MYLVRGEVTCTLSEEKGHVPCQRRRVMYLVRGEMTCTLSEEKGHVPCQRRRDL